MHTHIHICLIQVKLVKGILYTHIIYCLKMQTFSDIFVFLEL